MYTLKYNAFNDSARDDYCIRNFLSAAKSSVSKVFKISIGKLPVDNPIFALEPCFNSFFLICVIFFFSREQLARLDQREFTVQDKF